MREIARAHLERLFEQDPVKPECGATLRSLVNKTNECLRSLQVLGAPVQEWDIMLCYVIGKKLDQESRRQWELTFHDGSFPKLNEFLDFLDRRARALTASEAPAKNHSQMQNKMKIPNGHQGAKSCNLGTTSAPTLCGICKADHGTHNCPKLLEAESEERQELVRNSGICFNCLQPGHPSRKCNSGSCRKCGRRHNTLLHTEEKEEEVVEEVAAHLSCGTERSQGLLATVQVMIENGYGQISSVRSMIDGGAQASFITESCVERLGLVKRSGTIGLLGLGNKKLQNTCGKVDLILRSDFDSKFSLSIQAYVLPQVTSLQPSVPVRNNWQHLKSLTLADPSFNVPKEVDMILGVDVKSEIMQGGFIKGPVGTPVAELTTFGWIIWGPVNTKHADDLGECG